MEQELNALNEKNEALRDKLATNEQEKSSLINEREKRERECKTMQTELNRINSVMNVRLLFPIQ